MQILVGSDGQLSVLAEAVSVGRRHLPAGDRRGRFLSVGLQKHLLEKAFPPKSCEKLERCRFVNKMSVEDFSQFDEKTFQNQ